MSGVMELQPDDGPRSSLSIGPGFGRCSGISSEFSKRFVEGIGKLAGNMSRDYRKKTIGLAARMPKAAGLTGGLVFTQRRSVMDAYVLQEGGLESGRRPSVPNHYENCIIVGSHSINDQKNLEGRSPIRNAWITREGYASGTPRIFIAKCLTNWVRDSSLPWVRPRSETAVGLRRVFAKKFSSNDEIEDGLSRLYHIRAGPLKVVRKAQHISISEVS
ncbi:hypothetical protein BHM03_00027205 [Ensete ventricosum]|nr:hypothetical protein BHM03_00027205 [Ensete ventricosum]